MTRKICSFVVVAVLSAGVLVPFITRAQDVPNPAEQAAEIRQELVNRVLTDLTIEKLSKELASSLVQKLLEMAPSATPRDKASR